MRSKLANKFNNAVSIDYKVRTSQNLLNFLLKILQSTLTPMYRCQWRTKGKDGIHFLIHIFCLVFRNSRLSDLIFLIYKMVAMLSFKKIGLE